LSENDHFFIREIYFDQEIESFVQKGYKTAKEILTKNISQLHTLAKALLEYETLSGHQIKNLLSGRHLDAEGDIVEANINVEVPTEKKITKSKKIIKPANAAT
jgi:cell division protease FtsH